MIPPQLEREDLFDAAFLSRLRSMALRLRKRRQLQRRAQQNSPATGYTREFKDYRPYTAREDYRAIDWRLYARLDRLFVRLYEETQELHLHIILDTSLSMCRPHPAKQRLALRFAVALAYLGLSAQQRVSLHRMQESIEPILPPLRGQGHLETVIEALLRLPFAGGTQLQNAFQRFTPSRQRRGIFFVCSDFFGSDIQDASRAIARACSWPGEVHLLHLTHPLERDPALEGEFELRDAESGETRRFWLTRGQLQQYREGYLQFSQGLERECSQRHISFSSAGTEEPFEEALLRLLSQHNALTKAGG
jgi:uncharacterized protein (DUF58 family)